MKVEQLIDIIKRAKSVNQQGSKKEGPDVYKEFLAFLASVNPAWAEFYKNVDWITSGNLAEGFEVLPISNNQDLGKYQNLGALFYANVPFAIRKTEINFEDDGKENVQYLVFDNAPVLPLYGELSRLLLESTLGKKNSSEKAIDKMLDFGREFRVDPDTLAIRTVGYNSIMKISSKMYHGDNNTNTGLIDRNEAFATDGRWVVEYETIEDGNFELHSKDVFDRAEELANHMNLVIEGKTKSFIVESDAYISLRMGKQRLLLATETTRSVISTKTELLVYKKESEHEKLIQLGTNYPVEIFREEAIRMIEQELGTKLEKSLGI